jgi:hypothetical protein
MNAQQAVELATEHLITVTVDHVTKTRTWFGVGNLVVEKTSATDWKILDGAATFLDVRALPRLFKRGEAIKFCVRRILDARQDKDE